MRAQWEETIFEVGIEFSYGYRFHTPLFSRDFLNFADILEKLAVKSFAFAGQKI